MNVITHLLAAVTSEIFSCLDWGEMTTALAPRENDLNSEERRQEEEENTDEEGHGDEKQ